MPRPNATSPVDVLMPCIKAIPDWFTQHKTTLQQELENNFDASAIATTLASQLEKAQEDLQRERKEDKGITTQRDNALTLLRQFQKSMTASVERRLQQHSDHMRILEDFRFGAPSRIRSISDALVRLRELHTSLEVHRDILRKGGKDRTDHWLKSIESQKNNFETLALEDVEETKETKQAYSQRDKAQEEVAEFLKNMELTAQSVVDIDETALVELEIIFDRWNPAKTSASASETEQEVVEDNPGIENA